MTTSTNPQRELWKELQAQKAELQTAHSAMWEVAREEDRKYKIQLATIDRRLNSYECRGLPPTVEES